MIGKVPRAGRGFRGLVRYLLRGARRKGSDGRVAWTATRNLFVEDPAKVPLLMRMTAAKSVRVRRPVYHLVISWTPAERPTPEMMRQVADRTCRDLGLADHQRLYVAHRDTRHPHLHVVVNRVHPETGTAWARSNDYRRIEVSLARQAKEMGLTVVPGRHNKLLQDGAPKRARDGAYQKARREGREATDRMAPEKVAALRSILVPLFGSAGSWDDLERMLVPHGVVLQRKGQGAVLIGDTGEIKLSQLGANIRLATLERRLGPWNDPSDAPTRRRRPFRERDR